MEENAKHATVFDTDRQHLGDVYAKALLGIGQNSGTIDQLITQLDSFVDALDRLPKLRAILESPRVSQLEKDQLLTKVLAGRCDPLLANFLKFVCSKGRFDCLNAIQSSVHAKFDEFSGRVKATLTTAEQVDDQTRQKIAERLATVLGKQVQIETKLDPSIIGGLLIRVGDTVYDGSIANELKRVRSKAIERANHEIRQALDRFAIEA